MHSVIIDPQSCPIQIKAAMKPFLTVLVWVTGIALVYSDAVNYNTSAAIAQDAEGCFMINSSGEIVNLTSLCEVTSGALFAKPKVFQAKIKRHQAGTPVIDVTFNGKQKFEMLLDTGATQTTITSKMANVLKVVPVGTVVAHIASGEVVQFPIGRVASIEVGGAVSSDSMVLIGAVPLLGQSFFGGYDIMIKRDIVEFHPQ